MRTRSTELKDNPGYGAMRQRHSLRWQQTMRHQNTVLRHLLERSCLYPRYFAQ